MKFFILFALILFLPFVCSCVDINSASVSELDKIVWVGPATAQKIIDARPFDSVDDLVKVNGIGDAKLSDIKDQGMACVNGEKSEKEKENEKEIEEDKTEEDFIVKEDEKIFDEIVLGEKTEKEEIVLNGAVTKELVYESKNSKILYYAPYVFSGFLLIIIFALFWNK